MTADTEIKPPLTLEERYPIPAGKSGIMHELCHKGDVAYFWNAREDDEVAAARKHFDDMRKKKFVAYRSEGKNGHRGEEIKEFDPAAERIIFVKQHQGG